MIRLFSPAKINWFLRVMEPREDGYHDLESVFQEIALGDDLSFEIQNKHTCSISGFPEDVPHESNLIFKAWQLLAETYPGRVAGLAVTAVKKLPRGGGLGGGSSNAACTLVAINELNHLEISADTLEMLGAKLGSDVPFFIRRGCAVGRGRGEQLEAVDDVPTYHLILNFPSEHVSTRQAFHHLDLLQNRPVPDYDSTAVINALHSGDPQRLALIIHNDFEIVVAETLWYRNAKSVLESAGAVRVFLCGSGSTVAGLLPTKEEALKIVAKFGSDWTYTYTDAGNWGLSGGISASGYTMQGETS